MSTNPESMKIFFDTIGCRLNQAEIEQMAGQFRAAGHQILESAVGADIVVVNTCSVTAAAASDSRQKVRQVSHAGARKIILTGCWATLESDQASALPGVVEVISNLDKMSIPLRVMNSEMTQYDLEPIARKPLPGAHQRTRAFIKAQDGCNNICTFCVTRLARGSGKSVPKELVLNAICLAEKGDAHEVVLTGVHLGSWGSEMNSHETITDLIDYLLDNTSVDRIRLSSIEPWDLDKRFFSLWQNPRMCRHLHLPLQSGSASVLKRMVRHNTPEAFAELVTIARKSIPGVALTTDIIVGFPGETEEEFQESLAFVEQMTFSGGHVFRYSPREGTAAARMTGRVHGDVVRERAEEMRIAIGESESRYLNTMIGKQLQVLWEASGVLGEKGWTLHGLSDNNINVKANADHNRCNQIDTVQIERALGLSLVGTIK